MNECLICGKTAQHRHHLIFGSNRYLCDADRLIIPVCAECHRKIHDEKGGAGMKSKQLGQILFELKQAVMFEQPEEESRERFRKRYGKSFL